MPFMNRFESQTYHDTDSGKQSSGGRNEARKVGELPAWRDMNPTNLPRLTKSSRTLGYWNNNNCVLEPFILEKTRNDLYQSDELFERGLLVTEQVSQVILGTFFAQI